MKIGTAMTNLRNTFRTSVYIKIIDNITGQLRHRMESYSSLGTRFEIFKDLHDKDPHKINVEAKRLAELYPNDLDIDYLINKCLHFQGYMKFENIKYLKECFAYISNNDLKSTFPNLKIAMRIFLTIPVTSCSAERGFPALNRIKSEMRSTMGEGKLNSLMILYTASDVTSNVDLNSIFFFFNLVSSASTTTAISLVFCVGFVTVSQRHFRNSTVN
ncbi:unnamed protein product [Psylliodes chrysocephalus]|uniref:HAT C-terminal dimerisation domain-containing protein n=1 Tax=Psylliodes chrysocephalus TaxID=3402493 RepID=A0A9P0D3M6_9CUCU|nr:unnamed protein product [Psylliodes chrysocephala]